MVFSQRLHDEAMEFLKTKMPEVISNATDASLLSWRSDWRPRRRDLLSSEEAPAYMAVHLRRQDFVRAHRELVPSLRSSAEQALFTLRHHNLTHLFVATDAPESGKASVDGFEVGSFMQDDFRDALARGVAK